MYEWLMNWFLSQPIRIIHAGSSLFRAGMFLIVAGLLGRVATIGVSAIKSMNRSETSVLSLSDLYPAVPTWWIPESIVGYGLGIILVITGLIIVQTGREMVRALGSHDY